jgi:hypothetical protein
MPIWARKFYTNKIIEFKQMEKKKMEEAQSNKRGTRK